MRSPSAKRTRTRRATTSPARSRSGRSWRRSRRALDSLRSRGRVRGSGAPSGALAAFVALEAIDRDLYIVELDVAPEHAGARLGAALLDHAALLAGKRGLRRLSLRTFADVPWNAPYYRKLGFADADDRALPPSFAAIVRHEDEIGIDRSRRVTLARALE